MSDRSARVSVPASISSLERAIPASAIFDSPPPKNAPSSGRGFVTLSQSRCVGNLTLPDFPYGSIAEHRSAPSKAAAHRFQHQQVAALDPPVAHRDVERQR